MLPTAEEKEKIQEAAINNPELPLGSAEQFLMMLASISELPARLNLWLFKLDYENTEKVRQRQREREGEGERERTCYRIFTSVLSAIFSLFLALLIVYIDTQERQRQRERKDKNGVDLLLWCRNS